MHLIKRLIGSSLEQVRYLLSYYSPFHYPTLSPFTQAPPHFKCCFLSFCVCVCSLYSSEDDEEETEMYEHDYDGSLPKAGKRQLGKTRWTREEVRTRTPTPATTTQNCSHGKSKGYMLKAQQKCTLSFFFQDEKLKKLVEHHGAEDWKVIANLLSVSSDS